MTPEQIVQIEAKVNEIRQSGGNIKIDDFDKLGINITKDNISSLEIKLYSGAEFSILGIFAAFADKDSFKALADNHSELLNKPALTNKDRATLTPLGIATAQGRSEIIEILLEKDPELNELAHTNKNGTTFTPLGFAAFKGQSEIVGILLKKDPKLLNRPAQTNKDEATFTPLGIAAGRGQSEIIEILLKKGPKLLNEPAHTNKDGSTFTPLRIAVLKGKAEAIDKLLEYGASNCSGYDNKLNQEQKNKLQQNQKTEAFYDGDTTISNIEELNKYYLQQLCKQSGIPNHLLNQGHVCKDFVDSFKASDEKKIEDISAQLSVLWHETNPEKFQSTAPYDILARYLDQETQDKNDPKVINTIAAYETENGRYKSENLFKFQENIDELLGFYYQKPTNIKEIIKISQDWILPKEEYDQRDNLIKEIAKIPKHAIAIVAELQKQISQNKERISQNEAEIKSLKTETQETQEHKEERLKQEGFQKTAEAPGQRKIDGFFAKGSEKAGSSRGASNPMSLDSIPDPTSTTPNPAPSLKRAREGGRVENDGATKSRRIQSGAGGVGR